MLLDHTYFMQIAIAEAKKAMEMEEIPIGAVVVCNDIIIAKAHNLTETLRDATAHAEMQAFTAASSYLNSKQLKDCTLYVTLEPCAMCMGAAFWTKINALVFGAYDQKYNHIERKKIAHPQTKIIGGVLEEECSELLTTFFQKKRSINL